MMDGSAGLVLAMIVMMAIMTFDGRGVRRTPLASIDFEVPSREASPASLHAGLRSSRGGYASKMAKAKQNKKLYSRMRSSGVRKKIARQLSELPGHTSKGRKAPKPLREAVDRLEATVGELRDHSRRGGRKAAARKAARTRRGKADSRSRAARKGARKRAKT
jgi:hypothetical protein